LVADWFSCSSIFNYLFAFSADVKQRGAGKRSKYYQKYGNPNFGGTLSFVQFQVQLQFDDNSK